MTRWKCLALFVIFAAGIPAATLSVGTTSAGAGQTVNLSVALQTQGAQVSGLQFDISFDKTALTVTADEGAASSSAGKSISTSSLTTGIRVLVIGFNQTLISDGSVASLTIAVAASASAGTYALTLSGAGGTDPSGHTVAIGVSNGGVTVGGSSSPALSVVKSHSGSFVPGQTGAAYSVVVSNQGGAAATSGAVTVTESLPGGLSLVSMAGSGWNCSGISCSRGDPLNGGSSFPPVVVTVNVANNAPATVVNQVTVSGGGSAPSSAADPAAVGTATSAQTITFGALNDVTLGAAPFSLSATASSGLAVSFASTSQSVCTVSGNTVTVVSIGACAIVASQPGNGSFSAAPPVTRTFTVVGAAAPVVFQGGVVPVFSTNTTVQPGSWISIYGSNLAPSTVVVNDGNFPPSLGGVSVTVDGKPAYLWFVGPTQINLQVPDDTTTGVVNVVVTTPAGAFTSTVTLAAASPSLSLLLDNKHIAALSLNSDGSYGVVGPVGAFPYPTRPVGAGEVLVLYGVGFGPTDPPVKSGQGVAVAAVTTNQVTVTFGGVNVPASYSAIVGQGLYQINVTVPIGTPSGDQPIQASVNGLNTISGTVVAIR